MELRTKVGDRTSWVWTLYHGGSAVDAATGVTQVVVYARADGGTTNKIDGSVVDSATTGGVCTYTPTANDVDTAGEFDFMTVIQYNDGTHSKFPTDGYDLLIIEEALDE